VIEGLHLAVDIGVIERWDALPGEIRPFRVFGWDGKIHRYSLLEASAFVDAVESLAAREAPR